MNENSAGHLGAGVARWLRQNLPVAIFLTSLVSAAAGALINGTFRVANYDFRLAALEAAAAPKADRIAQIEVRLNAADERRIADTAAYGLINQRIGVLELQVRFLGEFAHDFDDCTDAGEEAMKPRAVLRVVGAIDLLVTLIGCTVLAPDLPTPPPMAPPAPVTKVAPLPAPPAAISIVRHFDAAKAREIGVVLGSEITAQQIDEIRAADKRARQALTSLGRQIHHPTAAAMVEAREAVQALENALH